MGIVNLLKKIYLSMPLKNMIVFESAPDFSDNTMAVFKEFVKRGYNKKYKLVWVIEKKRRTTEKNTIYVPRFGNSIIAKCKRLSISYRAKCFISCNRVLPKYREGQSAFYLTHGTPIKSVRKYYSVPSNIDYTIVASKNVEKLYAYEKHIDETKMIGLGFPRNDDLTNNVVDIRKVLETNCSKVIVWYPTYRQSKYEGGIRTEMQALPIIDNKQVAIEMNEWARKNNTLIVAKPHFAQDVSLIDDLKLSNIRFIDDSFFEENNISSYTFVGNCDALLTDYSSIYYDFTLCNKPIGVIWTDIDAYRKTPGFAVDLDFYLKGAEKIYNASDLKQFILDVANGEDKLKSEREEIRDIVNYSTDGRNTERVVDFIVDKAKL